MSMILRRRKLSLLMDDFERWIPRLEHPERGEKLYECGWALRGFGHRLGEEIDQLQRLLAIEVQLRTRPGPGSNSATEAILEVLLSLAEKRSRARGGEESASATEAMDSRTAGAGVPAQDHVQLVCDHAKGMLTWAALPRDSLAGRRRAVAWEILRLMVPDGGSISLLPLAIRAVGRAGHEEAVTAADFAITWCNLASREWPDELCAALDRLQKKDLRPSFQRRLTWILGEEPW